MHSSHFHVNDIYGFTGADWPLPHATHLTVTKLQQEQKWEEQAQTNDTDSVLPLFPIPPAALSKPDPPQKTDILTFIDRNTLILFS